MNNQHEDELTITIKVEIPGDKDDSAAAFAVGLMALRQEADRLSQVLHEAICLDMMSPKDDGDVEIELEIS
jgi:hypothetical protein